VQEYSGQEQFYPGKKPSYYGRKTHTAWQTPRCLLDVINSPRSTSWWTRKNNWKKGWKRRRKNYLPSYSRSESQKGHKELIHTYIDWNMYTTFISYVFKLKYGNISDEKLQ
jgi:hypothetical protein